MSFRYAGVCLLENPYQIDGIYDYRIPVEMEESVVPGSFVTVPFGTANRIRLALVMETRGQSAYPETKEIRTLCPESLSLDEEMLGLCRFLRQRTLCATGDAVRAMIPASALSRLSELYSINPETILNDSDEWSSSDLFVYDFLQKNGETSIKTLRERSDIRTERSVRRLFGKGYLCRRIVFSEAREGTAEKIWSLAVPEDAARLLAAGEEAGGQKLSSPKQKSVLSVLLEEGAPMEVNDLTGQAGVTQAVLKTMEKKGFLECTERRTNRNPYEAEYIGQTPQTLNEEQSEALETLSALAFSGEPKAALLQGVTGSGKTRVMTALIDRLLERGRGVIVLLPEIALTPQSVSIFCARYGQRVAVIHSALSAGERYDAYCRIRRGEADVVIGTRSAVFAPVSNLGAIIIDEEQEHTYKSDQNPKYHTKDIARYRCNYHRALMLLASATPSLESAKKARDGVYSLVRLNRRYGNASLPRVEITDMREEARAGNSSALGAKLCDELNEVLKRGEQAILFLNRRGYNRTVSCRSCGKPLTCPACSVAMTYHTRRGSYTEGEMVCHWCGKRLPLPAACPSCGGEHLAHIGYGTQRIEEELKTVFPEARILRMDTDTTVTKSSYETMLGKFRRHEADILLGTQMVTKGHDFPDVTLVGVLLADSSLYLDDYRASERTFAMLTQVIGRAGRRDLPGLAVIQTNNPEHEVIRLACEQDYDGFYEREVRLRRLLCFPPTCDIALLTLSGTQEKEVLMASTQLVKEINDLRGGQYPNVELILFGPFEAPVYRVDNRYRMRMVVKCRLTKETQAFFADLMCRVSTGCGKRVFFGVDFNPSNL